MLYHKDNVAKSDNNRKLYHRDVGIPKDLLVKLNVNKAPLMWSRHAILAANEDRYGTIKLISEISFKSEDVIEIELINNELVKVLVRQSYDSERDVIMAIGRGGVVKTVWFNLKSDFHATLDRSRYAKASV